MNCKSKTVEVEMMHWRIETVGSAVHVRKTFARHKDVIKEKGADFGPCF